MRNIWKRRHEEKGGIIVTILAIVGLIVILGLIFGPCGDNDARAGQGQEKTTICHPVAAATGGNTHAGYSIITTANPSVHIDEETGEPKHNFDGRVDFVVTESTPCPPSTPEPTETPTPTDTPTPPPTDEPKPPTCHDDNSCHVRDPRPDKPRPVTPKETAFTGLSSEQVALGWFGVVLAATGGGLLWLRRRKFS